MGICLLFSKLGKAFLGADSGKMKMRRLPPTEKKLTLSAMINGSHCVSREDAVAIESEGMGRTVGLSRGIED